MTRFQEQEGRHDPFGWLKTLGVVVLMFGTMLITGVLAARADGCTDQCRARHDQCRLQTKGSPSCDTQQSACIQSCIATLNKQQSPPKK